VGRGGAGAFELTFSAAIPADKAFEIALVQVDRLNPAGYSNGHDSAFLQGPWRSGPSAWQLPVNETSYPHTAVFHLASPTKIAADQELVFQIASPDVGRVRISFSPLSRFVCGQPAVSEELALAFARFRNQESLSSIDQTQLIGAYYLATTALSEQLAPVKTYRKLIADCRSGFATTMIGVQAAPEKRKVTRVLPRGNWQDESGELVTPATPDFLPKLADAPSRALTRLDLARWLTAHNNPLTARHFVNRTWKQFFGSGLSGQLDDLGNQGEWPSHPKLLDWLASEFQSDWDVKKLIRLIVTSETYQQRCVPNSQHAEIDPDHRLLACQIPRRLEAEIVRDNALSISGLLEASYLGGPSVFPYQPADYYANLQFPDRGYSPSPMELQYRRGVYVHWQRTFLHPSFLNFDAPARDECAADRPQSNSPQQALSLLNDPQFVEASLAFALRLEREQSDEAWPDRLNRAFQIALARPVTSLEQDSLRRLYERQREHYLRRTEDLEKLWKPYPLLISRFSKELQEDRASLAAWSQVCRVILNLHETITRF
jgi:hypothetical protein